MDKQILLERAVDITKEYAKSGHTRDIDKVLEEVYNKLKELAEDIES